MKTNEANIHGRTYTVTLLSSSHTSRFVPLPQLEIHRNPSSNPFPIIISSAYLKSCERLGVLDVVHFTQNSCLEKKIAVLTTREAKENRGTSVGEENSS